MPNVMEQSITNEEGQTLYLGGHEDNKIVRMIKNVGAGPDEKWFIRVDGTNNLPPPAGTGPSVGPALATQFVSNVTPGDFTDLPNCTGTVSGNMEMSGLSIGNPPANIAVNNDLRLNGDIEIDTGGINVGLPLGSATAGFVKCVGDVVASQNIQAINGDISALLGNITTAVGTIGSASTVTAGTSMTAGTFIEANNGDITATNGNYRCPLGGAEFGIGVAPGVGECNAQNNMSSVAGSITANVDLIATTGSVSAGTSCTAQTQGTFGTGVEAVTGNVQASAGNLIGGTSTGLLSLPKNNLVNGELEYKYNTNVVNAFKSQDCGLSSGYGQGFVPTGGPPSQGVRAFRWNTLGGNPDLIPPTRFEFNLNYFPAPAGANAIFLAFNGAGGLCNVNSWTTSKLDGAGVANFASVSGAVIPDLSITADANYLVAMYVAFTMSKAGVGAQTYIYNGICRYFSTTGCARTEFDGYLDNANAPTTIDLFNAVAGPTTAAWPTSLNVYSENSMYLP